MNSRYQTVLSGSLLLWLCVCDAWKFLFNLCVAEKCLIFDQIPIDDGSFKIRRFRVNKYLFLELYGVLLLID